MKQSDTKTRILDVAQDLIQRRGSNGMSYQDISDAIGIRKASIHTHFPKKDDLLLALLDRYNDCFLRIVGGILASSDTPEAKLRRYCNLFIDSLKQDQKKLCMGAMLGAEIATLNHIFSDRLRDFYQANEAYLVLLLNAGRQDGSFRFAGDVQSMAAMIFGLLEGCMLIARAKGETSQLHQVIEQLIKLVRE